MHTAMISISAVGRSLVAGTLFVLVSTGCALPEVRRTGAPPTREQIAQLWVEPGSTPRDLSAGVGGSHVRPAVDERYHVLEKDTGGFSITYRVRDRNGRVWDVKIGPEAQPEVVASRILWGVGYHQLPSYFVERWTAVDEEGEQMLGGARFRPRDFPVDGKGSWSWQENPFVGTREYNGLLSLLMLINSTDLKNDNNEIYEVDGAARDGAQRWYVVKDLGASLGQTGRFDPRRGYIDGFEREPFLREPEGEYVRFAYRGRHQELLKRITVADLKWACRRVLALTDRQWRDAFAAANYDGATTARFVARIRAKAQEGLALE
jgi:hypothetical protein